MPESGCKGRTTLREKKRCCWWQLWLLLQRYLRQVKCPTGRLITDSKPVAGRSLSYEDRDPSQPRASEDQVHVAMASQRSSVTKPLVSVCIVMAMLLLADVTAANNQHLSLDLVAGLTQQAHLRGNTNVPNAKKGAVVTEEMHVGDATSSRFLFADYSNGRTPSANCRRNCRRRP